MTTVRKIAGCDGKDPLPRTVALKVAQRTRRKGARITAYRCKVCGEWHVGSDVSKKVEGVKR